VTTLATATPSREHRDALSRGELAHTREVLVSVEHVVSAGLRGRALRASDAPLLRALCARCGEMLAAVERSARP
jgi:hypothetical protein